MYRENYYNSLQAELVEMVAGHLTPVARHYGYSEAPLEANIKWRPQVLLLGNYSSGKSTFINELLQAHIQSSGQAPTDDSFTVITYDESEPENIPVQVTEERDGKSLLNDPEYPFESLRKHGERFASHFRLKKVNSPFLKHLAIIDTPGMHDSVSERDRGYNYQEVVGNLAQMADLILILFDPHKAGTVRELHTSIKETLPGRTFEDRLLFVLNRIDECGSLNDLLRVYGTLCWNLSHMTGRKDIPVIYLSYSPHAGGSLQQKDSGYLRYLDNQREELKKAISNAPLHHLDHLATFIETHGQRLSHFLESLISYRLEFRKFRVKNTFIGFFISLLCGGGAFLAMLTESVPEQVGQYIQTAFKIEDAVQQSLVGGGAVALLVMILWMALVQRLFAKPFHRNLLRNIDDLTPLGDQNRQDSWENVQELAYGYLEETGGRFSLGQVKREYANVNRICKKGSREVWEALNEFLSLKDDEADAASLKTFLHRRERYEHIDPESLPPE
ncbi:dynamin family protein [Desulfobacterales bacterium HSG2]|nr:dynamin family protein [Desulfobacterales bacterium HSG2]